MDDEGRGILENIQKKVFVNKKFPRLAQHSVVVPLYKTDKKDRTDVGNYTVKVHLIFTKSWNFGI